MSKLGLRGFAGGLFVATTVFAYMYFFYGDVGDIQVPVLDQVEIELPTETEDFSQQLAGYLEEQNLVTLDKDEYETLLQAKIDLENLEEQAELASPAEETIIYQTHLVISSGMSSSQVADALEKAKIIDDRYNFQRYLEDHNLTQSIRIGEYTLNSGMSYEEIAEIIS